MEELASKAEIDWARSYDAYARIAATPQALWALVEPAHRELLTTGRVPPWCGVDFLRTWAFALTSPAIAELGIDTGLGAAWFALLDAISAHPESRLVDLPPGRTD